jgi:hypothetical protein
MELEEEFVKRGQMRGGLNEHGKRAQGSGFLFETSGERTGGEAGVGDSLEAEMEWDRERRKGENPAEDNLGAGHVEFAGDDKETLPGAKIAVHQAGEDRIADGVKGPGIEIEALWRAAAREQIFSAREGFVPDEGLVRGMRTEQKDGAGRVGCEGGVETGENPGGGCGIGLESTSRDQDGIHER